MRTHCLAAPRRRCGVLTPLPRLCCGILAGALAACGAARADATLTETDFLDELPIVLSAARLSQSVNEAPAAVTVIDQDTIRASGFRDIPDLLRLVPGFTVAYTRDNTWAAGYHGLGDAFSRRFQVLVDGRSIYSPHFGAVNWGELPLAIEDIERIEVVRGPNAAIHGANAFLAVINVITKTAAQAQGTLVSAQAGESSMRGLVARHGGGGERLRYRLTASAQKRDRFERDVVGKPPISGDNGRYFEETQTYFANGRFDWQLAPDSEIMAQFGVSRGDWNAGRDTGSADDLTEPRAQDVRAYYGQVAWHKVESARREWRVQATYSENHFDADELFDPGLGVGLVDVDQHLFQSRSTLELQVNEQWLPALRAVWGAEARRETVRSARDFGSGNTLSGNLTRAFGHLEWRAAPRLLLQGGAMLEHHYFTGSDLSPRATANLTLATGHVVRLGISRANRSPTFYEERGNRVVRLQSGGVADVVTVPSGGLDPERIVSREIGYLGQWPSVRLELDVRLFDDHIKDFIGEYKGDFDPLVPGTEFQFRNLGTIDLQGGEFQVHWRPTSALDLSAQFARVFIEADTRRENFNVDIPRSAPRNSWSLLGRYRFGGGWEASLFAQGNGGQKWLSEGDLVEAFTRIDARIARRWLWQGRELEAVVVGQNLGDDYTEFRDTNVFSRRVYAGLSLAW